MYYVITAAQAASATKFALKKGLDFDPFVGQQTDGKYLVEKALVDAYMHVPKIASINWGALPTKTHAQAIAGLKQVSLP